MLGEGESTRLRVSVRAPGLDIIRGECEMLLPWRLDLTPRPAHSLLYSTHKRDAGSTLIVSSTCDWQPKTSCQALCRRCTERSRPHAPRAARLGDAGRRRVAQHLLARFYRPNRHDHRLICPILIEHCPPRGNTSPPLSASLSARYQRGGRHRVDQGLATWSPSMSTWSGNPLGRQISIWIQNNVSRSGTWSCRSRQL